MEYLLNKTKDWVSKKLRDHVLKMGTLVSEDHYNERVDICLSCEHSGTVEPIPGIYLMGCTLCGCPLETKARMKTIMRNPKDFGTSLTIKEVITHPVSGEHLFPEVVRCSNYQIKDFWKEVDQKNE